MDTDIETQKDFTASGLAKLAGLDKSYVCRLCRLGVIPATKLTTTMWIIKHEDALNWLSERTLTQDK